jgi:hypothetical protein
MTADIDHASTDGAAPFDIDEAEIRAARKITSSLPLDFSMQATAGLAREHFEQAKAARRQSHRETRQALQELYPVYAMVLTDRGAREMLASACKRAKLDLRTKDPAIAVVALHGGIVDSERRHRFADVLRELLRRNVAHQDVAEYLAKPGQGINQLHKAYQRRRGMSTGHINPTPKLDEAEKDRPSRKRTRDLRLVCNGSTFADYEREPSGAELWVKIIKRDHKTAEARRVQHDKPGRTKDSRRSGEQNRARRRVPTGRTKDHRHQVRRVKR